MTVQRNMWRGGLMVVCLGALVGCATPHWTPDNPLTQWPELAAQVELTQVPFYPQDSDQCGPAALATVLTHAGIVRTPEGLQDEVYVPQRQGSLQPEMLAATRRAGALPYVLAPQLNDVLREVAAGHPVLVLQNLRWRALPLWHYAVVVGFDVPHAQLVLRSGSEARQVMSMDDFMASWAKADHWAFVAVLPDQLPASANEEDFIASAIALESVSSTAAHSAYRVALATWPHNLKAHIGIGNIFYRLRQFDDAREAYAQATHDHPDSADAWNNLAQTWVELGQDAAALEAARQAVTLGGPRLATYQRTLQTIKTPNRP